MRKPCRALALSALILTSPLVAADEYDPGKVPADTRWMVHIDFESVLEAKIFQHLGVNLDDMIAEIEEEDEYQMVRSQLGMDPLRALRSLTLYSPEADPETAVLQVHIEGDLSALVGMGREQDNYAPRIVDGVELHRWQEGNESFFAYVHTTDHRTEGLQNRVLISNDGSRISQAARVLRGESKSIAQVDDAPISVRPSAGSMVFVAANANFEDYVDIPQASALAKSAKSFVLEIGETGERSFIHATVEAEATREAKRMVDVIRGASALLSLVGPEEDWVDPALEFLDALDVRQRDNEVTLRFEYNTEDLVELLQELQR